MARSVDLLMSDAGIGTTVSDFAGLSSAGQDGRVDGDIRTVSIADLVLDAGLQVRVEGINDGHVEEDLRPKIRDGVPLDPIQVGELDGRFYVVQGFHRVEAYRREGFEWVRAVVVPCRTRDDLLLLALPSNSDHGLPLSRADRRRKVLLAVEAWRDQIEAGRLSQAEIARRCAVSPSLVSNVMAEMRREGEIRQPSTRIVSRGGQVYEMDTREIGRSGTSRDRDREGPARERDWGQGHADLVGANEVPWVRITLGLARRLHELIVAHGDDQLWDLWLGTLESQGIDWD